MRCEYDKMVLVNASNKEMTSDAKEKLEKHLEECQSCKERWKTVQRIEKRGKNMTQQDFAERTNCKEYLDVLFEKSVMKGSDNIITGGGVGEFSATGKVEVSDSHIEGDRNTIAGGHVVEKNNYVPEPQQTKLEPINVLQTSNRTPKNSKYKFVIIAECDDERDIEHMENIIEGIQVVINYPIISTHCAVLPTKEQLLLANIALRLQLKYEHKNYTLRAAVSDINKGNIDMERCWAGSTANKVKNITATLPKMLEWLLAK